MKEYIHGGDIYRHPDVLDYSANINPLGTPPGVIRAAKDSMERVCHYPDACQEKLKQALAEYEQVPVEWLICGNGAAELIFALVQAVKPKRALVLAPTFAEYAQALEAVGCEVNREILKKEDGFTLQDRILDRLQKEDLQMVFLCNPNNPTGILMDPKLLRKIVTLCEKRQIYLVVDECFIDFAENAATASILADTKRWRTLFILRSLTKMHAIPGIRIGYAVTSDMEFLEKMEQSRQPWSVSIPAQVAGMASLKEGMRVKRTCDFTNRERIWMENELNKLGITHYPSDANFILMRSGINLYEKLKKQKILIRDCSNYKGLGEGYYRVCMRQRGDNQKLIDALGEILYAGQGEF